MVIVQVMYLLRMDATNNTKQDKEITFFIDKHKGKMFTHWLVHLPVNDRVIPRVTEFNWPKLQKIHLGNNSV